MKLFKKVMSLVMMVVLMFTFVACTGGNNDKQDDVADDNKKTDLKVAIIADGAGFGSHSFNDVALEGVNKASEEFGFEVIPMEVFEVSDMANSIRTLIGQGVNFVVLPSVGGRDAAIEVSQEYPDVKFALLDVAVDGYDNIASVQYREHEAAFLLGALGAMLTEKNQIGFVGGVSSEIQDRFEFGYRAGVQYANPEVKVVTSYTGTFSDVGKGKEIANMMYGQGVDYIAPTAGAGNLGVFQAANEAGIKCFGAANGQFDKMPDNIVASQVKNIGNVAYNIIKDTIDGNFPGGESKEYGIKEGGVGLLYTPNEELLATVSQEDRDKIKELEQLIINSEIYVPQNEAEFKEFNK